MPVMRSATLVAPYNVRVEEIERPEVTADTVLIKVGGIGICGSNLHWWCGGGPATRLMKFPMPGAGGHEFSGTVVGVGQHVRRVRPGDRVAIDQFESGSCGSCFYCAGGLFTQCERRRSWSLQGFVEYLLLGEKGLYRLPGNIETHLAAVVQPYACAVSAVRRPGLAGGSRRHRQRKAGPRRGRRGRRGQVERSWAPGRGSRPRRSGAGRRSGRHRVEGRAGRRARTRCVTRPGAHSIFFLAATTEGG